MKKQKMLRVLITLVFGFPAFSYVSTAQSSQSPGNVGFTSLQQDTVDSVRVYGTQAYYGERGRRFPLKLRNRHIAQGLDFKVYTPNQYPLFFTGHRAIMENASNNSCLDAQVVGKAEMVNAYIEPATDEDYYQFHVSVIDTVVMLIQAGRGASPGNGDIDTIRMWLYDPDCVTELAYAEDSLPAGVEIMYEFTDPGEHDYRVKITGTGNDYGNYAFLVRDTVEYIGADTLPWNGENCPVTDWPTLRTHVFPESTSVHFLGVGEREIALDISTEWRYICCYDFDIDPGILVPNPPNPPDTIYPDTFMVVSFSRYWVSDTMGVIHFAEVVPCTISISPPPLFMRGDANADSTMTMGDAIYILKHLYVPGSPPPPCMKSADSDDDGSIAMSDAVYALRYLYVPGSPQPPEPFPDCGVDRTVDELDCVSHPCMSP